MELRQIAAEHIVATGNKDGRWTDVYVTPYADAQATIAALQARVNGLEKDSELLRQSRDDFRVKYESVKNDAITLQSQLTQRTAELERVRLLIKALPKVEGELTCSQQFDSAWRLQYWQVEAYGVADECLYRLSNLRKEEANAYAALLQHRQGMEG